MRIGTNKEIYTLTLNLNYEGAETQERQIIKGQKYNELPTPTRENYNFLGWYTSDTTQDETTEVTKDDTYNLIDNQTIYAGWEINKVDLTVNVTTENNVITNYVGKKITVYDIDNNIVKEHTLLNNESNYTFNKLDIKSTYNVTIDNLEDECYEFNRPSKSITLNQENNLNLNYEINKMFLYKEGNYCTHVTGGYETYQRITPTSGVGYGTATIESDGGLKLVHTGGDNFVYGTINKIVLRNYKKLYVDATLLQMNNNSSSCFMSNKTGNKVDYSYLIQSFEIHNPTVSNFTLNNRKTVSYIINTTEENGYFAISEYSDTVKLYNAYLEK